MGVEAEGRREGVFLLSGWSDTLLSPSEFLLNRKQICQMMSLCSFPIHIFKKLCAESLSPPSGFDNKASSNWIFRGRSTEYESGIGQEDPISWLWTFHVQKFNAMGWVPKLSEEIEELKRGLGWPSKDHKMQERRPYHCFRRPWPFVFSSWLPQEHRGFSCCRCCPGAKCSRNPALCSMKDLAVEWGWPDSSPQTLQEPLPLAESIGRLLAKDCALFFVPYSVVFKWAIVLITKHFER